MAERRHLDDEFLMQCLIMEQVTDRLGQLARPDLSSLPARMRLVCARCRRQLLTLHRELRDRPSVVRAERQREDGAP